MTAALIPSGLLRYGMGLIAPCKPLEVDLCLPLRDVAVGDGYRGALVHVRLGHFPVGTLIAPVRQGVCRVADIAQRMTDTLGPDLVRALIRRRLETPLEEEGIGPDELRIAEPADTPAVTGDRDQTPLVSVVVCTRGRPKALADCLSSLTALDYPNYEVIVVDNAPQDETVAVLLRNEFPGFRYLVEPEPGLSRARNRALTIAGGDIVAFTDDDVVVDRGWLRFLVRPFVWDRKVAAVTGLIRPLELEYEPQVHLEANWSFARGYRRGWFRLCGRNGRFEREGLVAYQYGAGANMAVRRTALNDVGPFDEMLGSGTPSGAGEDMDMFFRILAAAYTLVYEPAAMVHHRHRQTMEAVTTQIAGWVRGYNAYLLRACRKFPSLRAQIAGLRLANAGRQLSVFVRSLLIPVQTPRVLLFAMIRNTFAGGRALRHTSADVTDPPIPRLPRWEDFQRRYVVKIVDLIEPVRGIDDVSEYPVTLIHVRIGGRTVGQVRIINAYAPIPRVRLLDEIAKTLDTSLLSGGEELPLEWLRARVLTGLFPSVPESPGQDGTRTDRQASPSLSVVIATRDRPGHLRDCLSSLQRYACAEAQEIVVVDNNPSSGLTAPVVSVFPGIRLVKQPQGGASAARNTGIRHSTGEIIAFVDDDTVVTESWAAELRRAFDRQDVGAVVGNILARRLNTPARVLFEENIGLGKGFRRREFGPDAFYGIVSRAFPAWRVGAGANLAVRRSILEESGVWNENLGPGTAARAGEDLYLLYRIAKTSYTVLYEPGVCVLHDHRERRRDLYRQLFNYGVGHYAWQFASLFRDGDTRAIRHVLFTHPVYQLRRLFKGGSHPESLETPALSFPRRQESRQIISTDARLRRHQGFLEVRYPRSMALFEFAGNLWAFPSCAAAALHRGLRAFVRRLPTPSASDAKLPKRQTGALRK